MKFLPSKDSAIWRGLITAFQALIGMVAVALLAPGVKEQLITNWPEYAGAISLAAGLVSVLTNVIRRDVKNY